MRRVPKVSAVMRRGFGTVSPDASIRDVARMFLKKKTAGAAVVDESGRFLGLISTQGLMLALADYLNEEAPVGRIESYLDPDPPTLTEASPLISAIEAFAKGRASVALPVLRGERLVGFVTRLDVVRATMEFFADEMETRPGTLYLSALPRGHEAPPFED